MSMERNVRSAGIAFLKKNLIYMRDNYQKIINEKEKYIDHLFKYQDGWYDSKPTGTTIRVNSTLRIIRDGDFERALKMITSSGHKNDDFKL
ncbi:MAG: hypothetical protein RBQ97_09160 [Acholeplasma sp.]|nr:hypothetical protein [Acholeplasma sp.]